MAVDLGGVVGQRAHDDTEKLSWPLPSTTKRSLPTQTAQPKHFDPFTHRKPGCSHQQISAYLLPQPSRTAIQSRLHEQRSSNPKHSQPRIGAPIEAPPPSQYCRPGRSSHRLIHGRNAPDIRRQQHGGHVPMRPRLLPDLGPGPPPPVPLPLHRVPEAERLRVRHECCVPNRGHLSAAGGPQDPALRLHKTNQRREDDGLLLLQVVRRTNHAPGARGQRLGAGYLNHQGWRAQGSELQGSRTHIREERRRADTGGGGEMGDVTRAGESRHVKFGKPKGREWPSKEAPGGPRSICPAAMMRLGSMKGPIFASVPMHSSRNSWKSPDNALALHRMMHVNTRARALGLDEHQSLHVTPKTKIYQDHPPGSVGQYFPFQLSSAQSRDKTLPHHVL